MRIHLDVTIRSDEGAGKVVCEMIPLLTRFVVAVENIAALLTPEPPPPVVGIGVQFDPPKDRTPA